MGLAFRRSPTLILHWAEGALLLQNYALPCSVQAHPAVVELLDQFSTWKSLDDYLNAQPAGVREACERLVAELHRHRFLLRSDDALLPAETGLAAWDKWNPSADFFHMATRNASFVPLEAFVSQLVEKQDVQPRPAAIKRYDEAPRVDLPKPRIRGRFPAVLRERRTWRHFGPQAIQLDSLGTLLHLALGVQSWASTEGEGRVPLKDLAVGRRSPPAGGLRGRAAGRGLELGVYHYASDVHQLERLPAVSVTPAFDELLPTQWWYEKAGRWSHPDRGLRAHAVALRRTSGVPRLLMEAGHVCLTLCLSPRGWGWAVSARWPSPTICRGERAARSGRSVRNWCSTQRASAAGQSSSARLPGAVPTEVRGAD